MTDPQHARLRDAMRRYFRELKREEADQIADELIARGSMPALLAVLGIADPGNSDDQYAALLNYIRRQGFGAFVQRMGRPSTPSAPVKLRPSRSGDTTRKLSELAPNKSDTQAPQGRPHPDPKTRTPVPDADTGIKRVRMSIPEPLKEKGEAPPMANLGDTTENKKDVVYGLGFQYLKKSRSSTTGVEKVSISEAKAPAPSKPEAVPPTAPLPPKQPSGAWNGSERRSGRDRRSGSDRRDSIELIYRNKRWGKDRRNGDERRKDWHKGKGKK